MNSTNHSFEESKNTDFANFGYNPDLVKDNTKIKSSKLSLFLAFLVIVLLLFSGLTVFILIYPQSRVSQFLVQNSFLNELIDLDQNPEENRTKPINQLIGTDLNLNNLEFASSRSNLTVAQVIERNLPSVLSISIRDKNIDISSSDSELTAGTGFLIDSSGVLVSNRHVLSVACQQGTAGIDILGINQDGDFFELEILSIDPVYDLAILKIKTETEQNFPAIELFNSQNLQLGQDVLAIGNVLGQLQNTVTRGIVSGLNRTFNTNLKDPCTNQNFIADNLIQTDAAINRGNSGGPLFNSSGQLIGINTLASDKAENLALAIPSSSIKRSVNSFLENGKITSLRTSLESVAINQLLQQENIWLPVNYGQLIYSQDDNIPAVKEDSPEYKAGLREGDIILKINNQELRSTNRNPRPLERFLRTQENINQKLTLEVLKAKESNEDNFLYEKEPIEIEIEFEVIFFNTESNRIEKFNKNKEKN